MQGGLHIEPRYERRNTTENSGRMDIPRERERERERGGGGGIGRDVKSGTDSEKDK